ncbi:hypothetical protein GCM10010247_67390 [Streptomyces calvus]|nr:hypothetical protein GCM10010247_67390 [Streptomyces calvus]
MSRQFWRTIQLAIERDTWTGRLVVVFCAAAAVALAVYASGLRG